MSVDADVIDSIRRTIAGLDEFGGELYLGADRRRVRDGRVVERSDRQGSWMTLGYVIGYSHRARPAKAALEAEIAYEDAEPPELEVGPDELEAEVELDAQAEELEPEEAAA
jgi:hypothetical protein